MDLVVVGKKTNVNNNNVIVMVTNLYLPVLFFVHLLCLCRMRYSNYKRAEKVSQQNRPQAQRSLSAAQTAT